MAAVTHFHALEKGYKLGAPGVGYELLAKGFGRMSTPAERKEPVSYALLRQMGLEAGRDSSLGSLCFRRILFSTTMLGFFLLDRRSELWASDGRPNCKKDPHLLLATNVIIADKNLKALAYPFIGAHLVVVIFGSTKPDQHGARKSVIYLNRTGNAYEWFCPVEQSIILFTARRDIELQGEKVGPYLSSVSSTHTVTGRAVASLMKRCASHMGLDEKSFSCHSLRIGGACALLAAGYGAEVIKLMGRWASWCFSIYLRVEPDKFADVAKRMAQAYRTDAL